MSPPRLYQESVIAIKGPLHSRLSRLVRLSGAGGLTKLSGAGGLTKATAELQRTLTAGRPTRAQAEAEARPAAMPAQTFSQNVDVMNWLGRLGLPFHSGDGGAPVAPGISGGVFSQHSFTGPAGTRPYKLFVPHGAKPGAPLIVMLHGCTQTADDFAAGTAMNKLATEHGFLVLYPVQVGSANVQRCWNWFQPGDQARDQGEPSLIAGMTREVIETQKADPRRVYAAGLSAGGALASILGATYPDLFAAVGIHSGLASGAASDMGSAFFAMRNGKSGQGRHSIPAIIFHGDRDTTVHPSNASEVAAQLSVTGPSQVTEGTAAGGLTYRRTIQTGPDGKQVLEQWIVHGAGHAWSGGNEAGSFTEPRGPDASAEMVRFFLQHRLQRPATE